MQLDKVHLFGASLGIFTVNYWSNSNSNYDSTENDEWFFSGGFQAQKFAELSAHCPRVVSLILCNTFTDTSVFSYNESAAV